MNRRSFLRFLGLAPVAAPAVAQAAMAPTLHTGGYVAGRSYVVGSMPPEPYPFVETWDEVAPVLDQEWVRKILESHVAQAREARGLLFDLSDKQRIAAFSSSGDERHLPRTHNTAMACASTARDVKQETAA